jgi:CheY-like chemotaxis protein
VRRRIDRGDLDDVGRIMDAVEASSSRAASLTQRMLAFSRLQPLDFRAVDVNDLIQTVGDVLSRSIGENIKLTVDAQDGLWSADTDPSQLETAILNLVINARDAMLDGGQVILKTANRTIEDQTHRSSELNPGDYVMLSVADTGAGMSSDTLGRVFEPFFTTKPIGQGTGLGLSMVYGFVKQSRGHVVVESELGRGTVVSLYLPRHDGRKSEPEIPASDVAPGARDGEVILLAEDDPSIRLLVTDHLSELGYRVIAVSDGNAAFRQLNTDTRIDLLLTDIGLPGPSGRDVAARARLKRENLAILFVTGYESGVAGRTALVGRRIDLISKPFDLDRLAMRVRTLLDS